MANMDERRTTRISKFLSLVLRHQPEKLGLTLGEGGWVAVDDLLAASARQQLKFTRAELDEVVATNDKRRFSFDGTGALIRANQGHSVEIDLQLAPVAPPAVLYHGTADRFLEAILRDGLKKMSRNHVHLSADLATAIKVGTRHGRPVVLEVDAARMSLDDHLFYISDNGVWLADGVPAEYLSVSSVARH